MGIIYCYTNKINGKKYIGQTINPEQRYKAHKSSYQNPNDREYNSVLHNAFRKYGIHNFTFEILKQDFNSIEEMEDYEFDMIEQYDATNKDCGYNQTKFTKCHIIAQENLQKYLENISQPCAWVDKYNNIIEIYNSYAEAARIHTNRENNTSIIRNVCKGLTSSYKGKFFRDLDENGEIKKLIFKTPKAKKSIIGINITNPIDEIYFNSISEAAKKMNTDRCSLGKCISGEQRYSVVKGYIWRELDIYGNIVENDINIEQRIQEYNENNPVINGERHNITEWCKIYGISYNSYRNRIKNGMSVVEAITTPKRR